MNIFKALIYGMKNISSHLPQASISISVSIIVNVK